MLFKGSHISGPPRGIGMAFQDALLLPWRNVLDNVLLPIEIIRRPTPADRDNARDLLASVGLGGFENSASWQLSGGMRQRVSLCRALVRNPEVLLLDEPFSGIDPIAVLDLQKIISGLRASGIGVLITDHNVRETLSIVDRAYLIFEGRVESEGTKDFLINDPISRQLYLGERFKM